MNIMEKIYAKHSWSRRTSFLQSNGSKSMRCDILIPIPQPGPFQEVQDVIDMQIRYGHTVPSFVCFDIGFQKKIHVIIIIIIKENSKKRILCRKRNDYFFLWLLWYCLSFGRIFANVLAMFFLVCSDTLVPKRAEEKRVTRDPPLQGSIK